MHRLDVSFSPICSGFNFWLLSSLYMLVIFFLFMQAFLFSFGLKFDSALVWFILFVVATLAIKKKKNFFFLHQLDIQMNVYDWTDRSDFETWDVYKAPLGWMGCVSRCGKTMHVHVLVVDKFCCINIRHTFACPVSSLHDMWSSNITRNLIMEK